MPLELLAISRALFASFWKFRNQIPNQQMFACCPSNWFCHRIYYRKVHQEGAKVAEM